MFYKVASKTTYEKMGRGRKGKREIERDQERERERESDRERDRARDLAYQLCYSKGYNSIMRVHTVLILHQTLWQVPWFSKMQKPKNRQCTSIRPKITENVTYVHAKGRPPKCLCTFLSCTC